MIKWRIYRYILRFDFRVDFRISNWHGLIANKIVELVESEKNFKSAFIDTKSDQILFSAGIDDEIFKIRIANQSYTMEAEFKNGIDISEVSRTYGIKFLDIIQKILEDMDIFPKKFKKIGFRAWTIKKQEKSFEEILLTTSNKLDAKSVINNDKLLLTDLAFVGEYNISEEVTVRIQTGPYNKTEIARYFCNIEPEVKNGYISDIDITELKIHYEKYTFSKILFSKCKELLPIVTKLWEMKNGIIKK